MQKRCAVCPRVFEAKRASAKYCSRRCSMRASRAGLAGQARPEPSAAPGGGVFLATMAELDAAGVVDSSSGQAALILARRIDAPGAETGAGLAALVKQHGATLVDAVRGGEAIVSPLDELRSRRDRKFVADRG